MCTVGSLPLVPHSRCRLAPVENLAVHADALALELRPRVSPASRDVLRGHVVVGQPQARVVGGVYAVVQSL